MGLDGEKGASNASTKNRSPQFDIRPVRSKGTREIESANDGDRARESWKTKEGPIDARSTLDALLNERAVWMEPTAAIRALDDKTIVLEQDGGQVSAALSVSEADPNGPDAGKCSVAMRGLPGIGNLDWTEAGKPAPTEQIRTWQHYLSPEALKLIRENPDPQFGDLLLVIPPD